MPDPQDTQELPRPLRDDRPPPSRGSGGLVLVVIVLLLLPLLAAGGWWAWNQSGQQQQQHEQAAAWQRQLQQLLQQNETLSAELRQVGERQRSIEQRLTDLAGGARVLREELLGVGERAATLEDALARLARARQEGSQAMQLDEIEFLLQLASERLQLFADPASAERALQMAMASLDGIRDPVFAGVRQTLAAELGLLRSLPSDPRPGLQREIAALQRLLGDLPAPDTALIVDDGEAAPSRLQQLLGSLITVRRLDEAGVALTPIERGSRLAALKLQLDLAQAALERNDHSLWQQSLERAQTLFAGLFDPAASSTQAAGRRLQALRDIEPRGEPPAIGEALRELRNLRAARRGVGDDIGRRLDAREPDTAASPQAAPPAEAVPDVELEPR